MLASLDTILAQPTVPAFSGSGSRAVTAAGDAGDFREWLASRAAVSRLLTLPVDRTLEDLATWPGAGFGELFMPRLLTLQIRAEDAVEQALAELRAPLWASLDLGLVAWLGCRLKVAAVAVAAWHFPVVPDLPFSPRVLSAGGKSALHTPLN